MVSVNARSACELLKKAVNFAEAVKVMSDNQITYTFGADHINFSNGARVVSLPNSPESARGFTASCVIIDECAFIEHIEDMMQAIGPALTRNADAQLILATTPAGQTGYFYDLYQNALQDPVWYVQQTTIHDAIADGLQIDLESLHSLCPDPDVFAQEFECQFSKEVGAFIDFDLVQVSNGLASCGRWFGMDVGRKNDKSAITILQSNGDKIHVEDIIVLDNCSYAEQLATLKQLHKKHRFVGGLIDSGGIGSQLAEEAGLISPRFKGLQFTGTNKPELYEAIRSAVFTSKFTIAQHLHDRLKDDFAQVSRIVTKNGQVKYAASHTSQGHADMVSSLVLAIEASKEFKQQLKSPVGMMPFSVF